jgi:uncharacterized membrane protein
VDPHLSQWLNLVLRWVHIVTGIAWIGTSFYFNWLNARITPPAAPEPGVKGELWSVHGGGFYRMVKYDVAPERLPATLHWFKWEAYATWISGIALLALIYYGGARTYLLDPAVSDVGAGVAIVLGIATLVAGWVVYDLLCKSPVTRTGGVLGLVGFALVTAVAFGLSQVLSARAAYIHVGALLGTLMAANVFFVIIPSQREMVATLGEGRAPNAELGRQAALRSLHNNYMTLPVLFVMVSNHYPATFGHRFNWAILAGLSLVGVAARLFFNLRNQGRRNAWLLPGAAFGIVALALVTAPRSPTADAGGAGEIMASFQDVRVIVAQRCGPCHSSTPTWPAFPMAPLGVVLDTPEQIRTQAERIFAVTIASETMPLGNITGMTTEEREVLGTWIRAGARIR